MNNKAGMILSAIILVVALVVGIFVGWKFDDSSNELAVLHQTNAQLESQLDKSEIARVQECKDSFMYKYLGAGVSEDYFSVRLNVEKTNEEKNNFATKHELTINTNFSPPRNIIYLNIAEGRDIYDIMCSIKTDSEVNSVEMVVTSLGGNFQGV